MKKSLLIKLSTLTLSVCSLLCIGTACKEDEPKTTYHTVTWKNYDGDVLETDENVKSGTMPTYDSEAPTRANDAQYTYEFSGWSPEITTVAGDVVYVAQFTSVVNEYTVVWKNYDGSILETDENVQYGETPVYNGETPVKEKDVQYTYEFSGWNPETDTVTGNVTYTAQFNSTINKYTVTWKNYDGGVLEMDENVAYGTTPAYNGETPTKARDAQYTYTFDGWDKTVDAVNGDAVYTAKFMSTVNKYTVIWKDYDGSVLETDENIDYGTLPAYNGVTPTRNRAEYTYTFSGWDKEVVTITGDVTYTAQYTQELSKYTAIWKNYDGIVLETDTGLAYQTIPEYNATTPTRTKDAQYTYTFSGWSPAISKITDDVIYTAQYSTTINKYTVTWKNYDGTVLETDTEVPYGEMPVYNGSTPTREKDAQYTYTFNGWTTNVSKVTGNVDYIAKYSTTVNKYTITWKNYDGSILKTDSVAYGTKPVYNGTTPTKQGDEQYGYLFSGWSPAVSNVKGDAVYTAQFSSSINKYTVIWKNYDGTILETDTNVAYGSIPTYNGSNPSRPYDSLNKYTFEGWNPIVDWVNGDTVYTAVFSINDVTTFIVKYDANGGTGAPSSQTKNKGQSITLSSTIPTNGEHVFIGWSCAYDGNSYSKGSSFSLDANVVLYAIWGHGCETCGASGQVSYQKTCSSCNGNGTVKESKWYSCSGCGGDGELSAVSTLCSSCSGFGGICMFSCSSGHSWTTSSYATRICPYCSKSGSGSRLNTCSSCSGKGTTSYYPTCSACSGSGGSYKNVSVDCSYCSNGYNIAYKTCGTCNGSKNIKNTTQSFSLTLKNGSSTFATKTVYYGDSFKLNVPTKAGYTFVGWFDSQENGIQYTDRNGVSLKVWDEKSDKTLYAQWIENYTITYNLDGGTASNKTSYNIETPTVTLNNPTRTGYKFIGWSGTDIDGMSMEVVIPSISTGYREYTANWEIITYAITYQLNDGVNSDNPTQYTIATDTITLLNPTREHYDFVEWRLDGKKVTEILSGSHGDKALTAIWQPKTYSISYNLNGGTASNKTSYNIETETFTLNNPTKTGYTFIGWTGANGDVPELNVSVELGTVGDLEFIANWSINQYTITLVFNNGNGNEEVGFDYQEDIVIDIPTWNRKSFVGWYENADLTIAHSYTKMPNKNYTLYAKWETYDIALSYNETKTAISINDEINAELFGAIAIDTDEKILDVNVEVIAGQLQVGETITVRLTVAGLYNVKKAQTITDVYVYGIPTLICDTTKDYINVSDELVGDLFSAIGTDTFGGNTNIVVAVKEGEYSAGDVVTIVVKAIDVAGNEFTVEIPNVKVYGTPIINRDETIVDMRVSEIVSNEKFVVSATDSFGLPLDVITGTINGTFAEGRTITVRSSATDSKGNVGYIDYQVKVYGLPTISNATTKDFKVEDEITLESLGVVAKDSFSVTLNNVTLTLQDGLQTAGSCLTYLVVAVDHLGNENSLVIDNVRIFGLPEISCEKDKIKIEEARDKITTVSFDLKGATGSIEAQEITATIGMVYPEIPTRSGYAFAGWYDNEDCTGTPFDFDKNLDEDITLYAKWIEMSTTKHTREYFDVINHTTSSTRKSVTASSYSDYNYYYFTCYTSGSYTIYEYWVQGDFYFQVDNITTGTQINKCNLYSGKTSNSITFTANAGDVIRIGTIRYGSSYNYTSNGTFYVTGAKYPTAGGLGVDIGIELCKNLGISAKDSFGNELDVSVELTSGTIKGGEVVYYTLTTVDLVGNETVVTVPIRIYDVKDIVIDFNKYASDLIKLNSCGEEFLATATDSFGESITLQVVAVDGELTAGTIESIKLVAIDGAGNVKESEIIENIKLYGSPTITYEYDGDYIDVSDNPYALFDVKDSFGEELSFDIEVVDGAQEIGGTITYKVTATDIAGNTVEQTYTLKVIVKGKVGIALDVNDGNSLDNDFILVTCNEAFCLAIPTKNGYKFTGWSLDNVFYTDENGNSIKTFDDTFNLVTLNASWTKIYNISYILDGGENNVNNPKEYTVESDTITLVNPTKEYYDFVEWQLDGKKVTQIVEGSYGDKTLVAIWTPTVYTITYELNGGKNNSQNIQNYTIESDTEALLAPTRDYYDFVEWQLDGEKITKIVKGSYGDKIITAVWTPITYTITYQLPEEAVNNSNNPLTYTVESETIELAEPTWEGYKFLGWRDSNDEFVDKIIEGAHGDKILTSTWETISYTISYQLNDGYISSYNPAGYHITSGAIVLNNPTRVGYKFLGWSGTNIDGMSTNVVIPSGSTGNREYTANWEAIEYTITYELDGGTNSERNPERYTIEDGIIWLEEPTKAHYEFCGWWLDGKRITEIPYSSYGDKTIDARWIPTIYTITYNLNGGDHDMSEPIVEYYTIEDGVIRLSNPTKIGYNFLGWSGTDIDGMSTNVVIPSGSTGNREYTANWEAIEYTITYELDGGTNSERNPERYTIEDGIIWLEEPTKAHYEFCGWWLDGKRITEIPYSSYGDKTIDARWIPTIYTITYNLNGGDHDMSEPIVEYYTIEDGVIRLSNPTKIGYNFLGWSGTEIDGMSMNVVIPSGSTGNREYTANWEVITYTITYELDGGSATNAVEYTIESETIVLTNSMKAHYDFVEWQLNGEKITEIAKGSYGNKALVAVWKPTDYTITYELNGGTVINETTYTIESTGIVLNNPTKTGYTFLGWSGTDIDGISANVVIPSGSTGDREYTANWEVITYTITYELDGESTTNVTEYTIESETIVLSNPTKAHYDFVEWQLDGKKVTEIASGSYGDKTLVAVWTPTVYTIAFELNGGSAINETTYTIESEAIALVNPTKTGYTFLGWSGTDIDGISANVVIPSGSTRNREYTANWEVITYTITYELDGGSAINAVEYTIESETIVLSNPTKAHYDFVEWQLDGKKVTEIASGSYGDKTLVAVWTPTVYTIAFELNGGSAINETTYTIESEAIALVNPTKTGYTFLGWSGTDIDGISANVVIPSGSTGDREYTASWGLIIYTITYELNGGTISNQMSYTVESDAIILNNPTKKGYSFIGWSGTDIYGMSSNVVIPSGTTGNREYTANWKIVTYTITYNLNGGSAVNVSSYTIESNDITIKNPERTGYIFQGWIGTSITGMSKNVVIPQGSMGNRTYTAQWQVIKYNITYELNGGENDVNNPKTYSIQTSTITLKDPIRIGYVFSGWYKTTDYYNKVEKITKGSYGELVLYAKWEALIICDNNGVLLGLTERGKMEASVTIPEIFNGMQITRIANNAFKNCTNLVSLKINHGVNIIGDYAFKGCTSLERLDMPNGIRKISENAFEDCANLNYYEFDNAYYLGNEENNYLILISAKDTSISTCNINENTSMIWNNAFYGCGNLVNLKIPNSVTAIGNNAFKDCNGLVYNKVYAGDGYGYVSYLGNDENPYLYLAFASYENHGGIVQDCKIIGYSAFANRRFCSYITIPEGVTFIGEEAFYGCSALTSLTIPSSVTFIDESAFLFCSELKKVNYKGTIDQWAQIEFCSNNANPLNYANNLYINNVLVTNVVLDKAIKISNFAFYGCNSLTSVVIGDSVTSISSYAFGGCRNLTSVYYKGTASDWSNLSIDSANSYLTNATRYYYSENQPIISGNYWHYDANGNIAVW